MEYRIVMAANARAPISRRHCHREQKGAYGKICKQCKYSETIKRLGLAWAKSNTRKEASDALQLGDTQPRTNKTSRLGIELKAAPGETSTSKYPEPAVGHAAHATLGQQWSK